MLHAALLLLLCQAPEADPPPAPRTWQLELDPWATLWFEVRARAAKGAEPADLPGMAAAVEAAHRVEEALGDSRLWPLLDARAAGCANPAELRAVFAALPDPMPLRGGRRMEVRAPALALADALAAAWPAWREQAWPAREKDLDPLRRQLQERLDTAGDALLRFLHEPLELPPPVAPLRVVLLPSAPPPGGVTLRAMGGPLSFVEVTDLEPGLVLEAILHESLHQLAAATPGNAGGITRDLQARLREAGVTPRDRLYRDLPHAVLFVHAAAAVRRFLAPGHRDYGEVRGTYARLGPAASTVRRTWPRYLAGELQREEALDLLVR